jgi:Sec-independent protein translocase protein TatA
MVTLEIITPSIAVIVLIIALILFGPRKHPKSGKVWIEVFKYYFSAHL